MSIAIIFGILLIILIVSLIVWWQIRKIRLKEKMVEHGFAATGAVACVGCDYNLYGLASDGKCPECSCPIHISIPAAAPSTSIVDEASFVEKAVPCVGCGNDLRGSRRHHLCKTCGAPAWFSVPTTWLRHCDPAWLRRVRSGLTWWLWTLLIAFVLGFSGTCVAGIWAAQVNANADRAVMLGTTPASIVAGVLTVLVVWRISTPNPALKNRGTDARLRQVTRAATIVALVSSLSLSLVLVLGLPKFYMYVTMMIGLGGWVSSVGVLLYLREFACRIPNRKFIHSLTLVMWWLCSATLMLELLGFGSIWLTDLDATQTPATQPPDAYMCFMGVLGIVSFGFTIWLVVLLFRLRTVFRRALDNVEPTLAVEQP